MSAKHSKLNHSNATTFDAGDEEKVTRRTTKANLVTERKREQLRVLCEDKRMREFLWDAISLCGVYKESFTGNSHTFFNEGRRSVGLKLLEQIMKADPTVYGKMRLEAEQGAYD